MKWEWFLVAATGVPTVIIYAVMFGREWKGDDWRTRAGKAFCLIVLWSCLGIWCACGMGWLR